jgi:hypothetical protein
MNLKTYVFGAVPTLAIVALAAACGGETLGTPGPGPGTNPGVDAGTTPPGSGGGSGIIIGSGGGSGEGSGGGSSECVNVEVTPAALACSTDSDCTLIASGTVCADECQCPNTPVNEAAATAYENGIPKSGGPPIACACPAEVAPQCIGGQCTTCGDLTPCGTTIEDAGPPIIIVDAGPPSFDSGPPIIEDGGVFEDGSTGTCVDIDLSTYDQSCNTTSDCIDILSGEVCDGTCDCFGSPVNISEQARYDQAISGIEFAECGCPAFPPPQCIGGMCLNCGDPSNPCPAFREP